MFIVTFLDSLDIMTHRAKCTLYPGDSSLRKPIISEYSSIMGAGPVVVTCDIGPQLPPGTSAASLKVRSSKNGELMNQT